MAGVEYAGFWIRLLAAIIDGIILSVVNTIVEFTVESFAATILIQILVGIGYTLGFWIAMAATPGKMVFGMRIVMANGEPLEAGPAVLRYIGYILSIITLGLGYLMIAFRKDKRGLHDLIAGTAVVRGGRSMLDS